jgi:hypothetical protein
MLVFLTSIRHPHNSNDYRQVERLFDQALRSVCAQTDPNFRVVVVCNAIPRVEYQDPRVFYHVVDYPPPSKFAGSSTGMPALSRDKGTKLLAGMLFARRFRPSYFAIFDADDLLSNRIAAFVNARPDTGGWYVDAGYAIDCGTWRVQRKHGLVRYCGTSLIPNAAALLRVSGVGDGLRENARPEDLLRLASPSFIDHIIGNHPFMVKFMSDRGVRMRALPFRAVAWVIGTGQNHTMTGALAGGVPMGKRFAAEFTVTEPAAAHGSPSLPERVAESMRALLSALGSKRDDVLGRPAIPAELRGPAGPFRAPPVADRDERPGRPRPC